MPQDTRETRQRATREFTGISVLVYLAAAVLLAIPAFFLATGVEAIGAGLGWWTGDPDARDNADYVGTAVGVVSAVLVLVAAAAIMREIGRRFQLPVRTPIIVGTAVLIVGLAAVCVGVVTAA